MEDEGTSEEEIAHVSALLAVLSICMPLVSLSLCDSSGDLYPVTQSSFTPHALLSVSPTTWHQRLGHPGEEVLRVL
nr:ribonuclease H-like domain-containing protein [Tanacetum cinerariifolium]